ncbi:MAG: hypothetical protein HUJ52_02535 [Malacoplasma sp.]|nr:hypothetical protein [Malacoplasma sp.]
MPTLTENQIPTDPLFWVSFITGILAAICIAVYTYPNLIRMIKTKDTTVIPWVMYCILSAGSLLFIINGVCGIVSNWAAGWQVWGLLIGLTAANVLSFASSFITIVIKALHCSNAKKNNMTEKEYCLKLAKEKGMVIEEKVVVETPTQFEKEVEKEIKEEITKSNSVK